ncbi:potassium channel family protein [Clostridium sp. SM-530-WT-3G]|uniref:potassium channel family protein n=1 Tax=Clostridium sp. SM-530-WT-3G TaxID=2725303 RepID=UPI00145C66CB|nr:potassium channel family protein [Clostridium sp. SM-530-WT-3G]NME82535.1 two pore domain potassium channel family protein [Clostridium sp. SM-530-WT-3G]
MESIGIWIGVFIFWGIMYLSTLLFYTSYLKRLLEDKFAMIKCIISLFIPIYGLTAFGIIQTVSINLSVRFLLSVCIVIFLAMIILATIYNRTKKDKYAVLFGIASLLFLPSFSILLSKNKYAEIIYHASLEKFFQGFSLFTLLTALYLAYTFSKLALKLYKEKDLFNVGEFCRYIVLYIVSFAIIFTMLMAIDTTHTYMGQQLNIEIGDQLNFSNSIMYEGVNSILQIMTNGIYFSIITFSTIGYGDIVPKNIIAKIIVILEIIGMFYLMYIGLGIALSGKEDKKK